MPALNSPTLAAITLLGFICLSYAALHRHEEAAYSHSVFAVMDRPSDRAQAIMDIWNISDDDLRKPVRIFGK